MPAQYERSADPGFYWPACVDPLTRRTVRTSSKGRGRPIGEISLVEIGNAMVVVAEQSGGSNAEDLKRRAANLLGITRIVSAVAARLDEAPARALAAGTIVAQPSGIVVAAWA